MLYRPGACPVVYHGARPPPRELPTHTPSYDCIDVVVAAPPGGRLSRLVLSQVSCPVSLPSSAGSRIVPCGCCSRWSWCVRLSAPPRAPIFGPRVSAVRRPFPPCFILPFRSETAAICSRSPCVSAVRRPFLFYSFFTHSIEHTRTQEAAQANRAGRLNSPSPLVVVYHFETRTQQPHSAGSATECDSQCHLATTFAHRRQFRSLWRLR
jgi:hypothetical protein